MRYSITQVNRKKCSYTYTVVQYISHSSVAYMHIRISSYRRLSLIVVLVPLVVIRTLLVGVVRALLGGAVRALLAVISVFGRLGLRGHAYTVTPHRIDQLLEDHVV